jgi:maltooligosyltrehalose trehalohydrolase
VVFNKNHDQVGNRAAGERLSTLVSFEGLKLAAGITLLSPFVPLLFMGEEYGETAPFPYFISHTDPELVEAVREGRREEFRSFTWGKEPPDPQAEATFQSAKLDHALAAQEPHRSLFALYQRLIRLRKETVSLARLDKDALEVVGVERKKLLFVQRWSEENEVFMVFNFSSSEATFEPPVPYRYWSKLCDSAEEEWRGPGSALPDRLDMEKTSTLQISPRAFVLFKRQPEGSTR